jgi:hypothetical protein
MALVNNRGSDRPRLIITPLAHALIPAKDSVMAVDGGNKGRYYWAHAMRPYGDRLYNLR